MSLIKKVGRKIVYGLCVGGEKSPCDDKSGTMQGTRC